MDYLRKDYATPSIYYGYSYDLNAAAADNVWSIKKVTTSGSIETVEWTNSGSYLSKWDDRVASFVSPTVSLSLTYSTSLGTYNNVIFDISWNQIIGVNLYQITISETEKVYSGQGVQIYSNPNFDNLLATDVVKNFGKYIYPHGSSNLTYSVTVMAMNVAGSTSSSINILT